MMANYRQYQHVLQLLPGMANSFLLVLSQNKDGILWLKILLGNKQSKCSSACESCWLIQIPSCGRK